MSERRKQKGTAPDSDKRRAEAQMLIEQILHGRQQGMVDPAVAEDLRKHLAKHPGQPDRALLAHFQESIPGFDGVFHEDL